MGDYCTHADVEKRIPDIIREGQFSDLTAPVDGDVDEWIDQVDGEINSRLKSHGYIAPVVLANNAETFAWVTRAVVARTCVLVMSNRPGLSYDPDQPDPLANRMSMFWHEWTSMLTMINEETLFADRLVNRAERLVVGSAKNLDGDLKDAVFTRDMYDYPGGPGKRGRTSEA